VTSRLGPASGSETFFSFGTNDLTQTTFGISRDDAETSFLSEYLTQGILPESPFDHLDEGGVGRLMEMAVRLGATPGRGSTSASAASTEATRRASPSATGSGWTTCPARPSEYPWRVWRRRTRRCGSARHGRAARSEPG